MSDGATEGPAPGATIFGADCDPEDPQRDVNFYERFSDGVDSNCDDQDDPVTHDEPCSCDWLALPGMPEVSHCGKGFEPAVANAAVATAELDAGNCPALPDLTLSFVVQCKSLCFGAPIYFSVANVGGVRSAPATVRLVGSFRAGPPRTPLEIEPLEPGQHTALIEVFATGLYRIVVETTGEQCSSDNDQVSIDAYDQHCGFLP